MPVTTAALASTRPGSQPGIAGNSAGKRARRPAGLQVLIVEDDEPVLNACSEIASSMGHVVIRAENLPGARDALTRTRPDVVLLDLRLPGGSGATLLDEIRASHPRVAVVVMTAYATVNSAVDMMRNGASDFLTKPFALEDLSAVLERAAERHQWSEASRDLQDRLRAGKGTGVLAGNSPALEKLTRIVAKVAFTNHPVLVVGEEGTGKETLARSIHAGGPHATSPFVPVDCGSLAPALLDAELFGSRNLGAAGAWYEKLGLLAKAGEGTIFLDEIGELSLELQSKLVRALQDKVIRPSGDGEVQPLRARILAASSRDLGSLVEAGRFRKDLFYKLNVVNLRVPPLRERREDLPLLAGDILQRTSRERGVPYSLSQESLDLLQEYEWPGNVRELEAVLERACALSGGPILHLADLPTQLQNFDRDGRGRVPLPAGEELEPPVRTLEEVEKETILHALRFLKGDKMQAAKILGIGKTTLYRKLKEYGIPDGTEWL